MANDPYEGMSEAAKQSTLDKVAKLKNRGKGAAKRAKNAATRAKTEFDTRLAKYEALGATPEQRQANARSQKIAEIQARQPAEAARKARVAENRTAGRKKAAETRKRKKVETQNADLRKLLEQIRESSDDKAIKLLQAFQSK